MPLGDIAVALTWHYIFDIIVDIMAHLVKDTKSLRKNRQAVLMPFPEEERPSEINNLVPCESHNDIRDTAPAYPGAYC